MKTNTLLAMVATGLIAATGVNSLLQPPPRQQDGPPRGIKGIKGKKKSLSGLPPCIIRRATFGGTESALLRLHKDGVTHYVVLDLPGDNPAAPAQQSAWLDANYGSTEPAVVGVFPTVAAAVGRAALLCKRN